MRKTRAALCVGMGLLFVAMWASTECPHVQGGLTDKLGLALVLLGFIYGAFFFPPMKLWRSGETGKNHRGRNLKPGPAYLTLDIGPVIKHRYHGEAMWTFLDDLDAFYLEHRSCGRLGGGLDGERVWMTCDRCEAQLVRSVDELVLDERRLRLRYCLRGVSHADTGCRRRSLGGPSPRGGLARRRA